MSRLTQKAPSISSGQWDLSGFQRPSVYKCTAGVYKCTAADPGPDLFSSPGSDAALRGDQRTLGEFLVGPGWSFYNTLIFCTLLSDCFVCDRKSTNPPLSLVAKCSGNDMRMIWLVYWDTAEQQWWLLNIYPAKTLRSQRRFKSLQSVILSLTPYSLLRPCYDRTHN